MKPDRIDYPFFIVVLLLVCVGFAIFSSAALGLLVRDGATFSSVASSQVLFGIVGGVFVLVFLSRINYRLFSLYALPFFIFGLALTWLTFIPGINLELKGANRWLQFAGVTFQPSEVLKFATVVFLASYLAAHYKRIHTLRYGLIPFLAILGCASLPLFLQPDLDGILILSFAGIALFFAAGGRLLHILVTGLVCLVFAVGAFFANDHAKERLMVFIHPTQDSQGTGYQLQQSLIAIGSGELFGRGFGQSIQKFSRLPEPIGDSVFAVASEEFGFIGATFLVLLFLAFVMSGLRIAARTGDRFGGLLVLGLVILIASQSFLNIASMLGLFPLSGLPLIFVSKGGSAMLVALAEVGVILSVSRKIKPV